MAWPATGTVRAATARPSTQRQRVVLRCPTSARRRAPCSGKKAARFARASPSASTMRGSTRGLAQRLEQQRHLGPGHERGHDVGALRRPRRRPRSRRSSRRARRAPATPPRRARPRGSCGGREGKRDAPRGEPVAGDARDHELARQVVGLRGSRGARRGGKAAHPRRAATRICTRRQLAQRLAELDRLHRVAAHVEPEDAPRHGRRIYLSRSGNAVIARARRGARGFAGSLRFTTASTTRRTSP